MAKGISRLSRYHRLSFIQRFQRSFDRIRFAIGIDNREVGARKRPCARIPHHFYEWPPLTDQRGRTREEIDLHVGMIRVKAVFDGRHSLSFHRIGAAPIRALKRKKRSRALGGMSRTGRSQRSQAINTPFGAVNGSRIPSSGYRCPRTSNYPSYTTCERNAPS